MGLFSLLSWPRKIISWLVVVVTIGVLWMLGLLFTSWVYNGDAEKIGVQLRFRLPLSKLPGLNGDFGVSVLLYWSPAWWLFGSRVPSLFSPGWARQFGIGPLILDVSYIEAVRVSVQQ